MENISPPAVRVSHDIFVVELSADYSHLHENMLEHLAILPLLAESSQPPRIVLDMSSVQFIGSALIGLLVSVSNRLSARGGTFAIAGAGTFCKTVISTSSLDTMLPTYESVEAAADAMSSE